MLGDSPSGSRPCAGAKENSDRVHDRLAAADLNAGKSVCLARSLAGADGMRNTLSGSVPYRGPMACAGNVEGEEK